MASFAFVAVGRGGPQSERTRKDITREFKKQGLDITISTNLKICNFLDVTLNLKDGTYYPYRKPNNETLYVNTNSNHPRLSAGNKHEDAIFITLQIILHAS